MQCCLTQALRCRLNTTLSLSQSLLLFMGEKNSPVFNGLWICPWEGIVSALNHQTASWCTCVFLGGLWLKKGRHGLAQTCEIWEDQSPGLNGFSVRSWTEPAKTWWLCSGISCGKTPQSSRSDGHEENHNWRKSSSDTGLDAAMLWLGERIHTGARASWAAKLEACSLDWIDSGARRCCLCSFFFFFLFVLSCVNKD